MKLEKLWLVLLALMALSSPGLADAPLQSLVPAIRPGADAPVVRIGTFAVPASLLPVPRPMTAAPTAPAAPRIEIAGTPGAAVGVSFRPVKRPRSVLRRALKQVSVNTETTPTQSKRGSVCGVRSIRGKSISAIPGKLRGCGIASPVQVTMIDGVALSTPARMNCNTAKALNKWVAQSLKPAVGRTGGGVKSLKVAAHYACRTRNNKPGGKISEHGKGNAIDISAINLADGSSITVLQGWRDRTHGKILKRVHREACGTFSTVLGPNADRYHQDHFHFDVARHRGGAYCR